MRYTFAADHYLYLASIGLIALLVSLIPHRAVGIVVVLMLAALTFRRAMIFRDLHTLWPDTIAKNPTAWMPRNNYATLLMSEGKLDDAQSQLTEALKHHPQQPELLINAGALMERRGRPDAAIALYEQALQRRPADAATAARLHLNRGIVLASNQQFEAACAEFREAVKKDPSMAEGWNNLGAALEKLNDTAGAIAAYERALQANPNFERARQNLQRLRLIR
jgi:tetratricopeptide (TPR) repeat protein